MAKKHGKKAHRAPKKKCPKGPRGKTCRARRRGGLRGLGDLNPLQQSRVKRKMAEIEAGYVNAGKSAPSRAELFGKAKSELCKEGAGDAFCQKVGMPTPIDTSKRYSEADILTAEQAAAHPVSAAKKARSKKAAANKGCKAPKGRVCVGADVAKVGRVMRRGCKPTKIKGTYVCTQNALKMKAAGKHLKAATHAPKGYKYVSWKKAQHKSGALKRGCRVFHGRPVCSKKVA